MLQPVKSDWERTWSNFLGGLFVHEVSRAETASGNVASPVFCTAVITP